MTYFPNPFTSFWQTAMDADFTADPTQTISPDSSSAGAYGIVGQLWYKDNSAGDRVPMVVTNGTGLVISPIQATDIVNTTYTAPVIRLPIIFLIPDYHFATPLRIWTYFSSDNLTNNGDSSIFGLMIYNFGNVWPPVGPPTYANQRTYVPMRHCTTSGLTTGWAMDYTAGQSNFSTPVNGQLASNQVGVADFPNGIFGNMYLRNGVWSSGWPSVQSLNVLGDTGPESNGGGNIAFGTSATTVDASSVNLFLGSMRRGTSTNNTFATTIARVRVDYGPTPG